LPKLPRLPAAEVVAALKRLGFEEVRQKGSHLVLRRTSINAETSMSGASRWA
jgi:predicted RNA binding protein YcfA (HicA-like mRNA interferase family)